MTWNHLDAYLYQFCTGSKRVPSRVNAALVFGYDTCFEMRP